MDETNTDQGGDGGSPKGRKGRRAARKAAGAALTTASTAGAVKRSRRLLRGALKLTKAGLVAGAVGAAVWWAVQRRGERDSYLQGPSDLPTSTDAGGAPPVERPVGAQEGHLVDVSGAAKLLEVDESRIPALVDGGLLDPVGTGDGMRFRVTEVQAVRLQGG